MSVRYKRPQAKGTSCAIKVGEPGVDVSASGPTLLVAALMVAATPLWLAAIGELVVEEAGVLNLGVEGMMITGAFSGFAAAVLTGSPMVGFLCAAIGGASLSVIFAILTQYF